MAAKTVRARFDASQNIWFVYVPRVEPDAIWCMRLPEMKTLLLLQQQDRYRSLSPGDKRDAVGRSITAIQQNRIQQTISSGGKMFEQTAPTSTKQYFI